LPYKIVQRDGKYLVYKIDAEENAIGDPLGEHDTEEEAQKQIAALYASEKAEQEEQTESVKPDAPKKTRTGYLCEITALSEATMDADNKRVRVTLIRPGWSANNRYYGQPMLARAASMFENAKAYFDHPSKAESKDRPERSVRDIAGWYSDVRSESDGRITADLNIIADSAIPLINAAITRNSNLAGLSINAIGITTMGEADGKKGVIVESIEEVKSGDIVTTPAAGGKFEELLNASVSDGIDIIKAMPMAELIENLRDARQDVMKALQKEWKVARDSDALRTAREEVKKLGDAEKKLNQQNRTLQEALDRANAELVELKRQANVDRMLETSKLPKSWRDALRVQMLQAQPDGLAALLEAETKKYETMRPAISIVGAGANVTNTTLPAARFNPIAAALGATDSNAIYNNFEEYMKSKIKESK
jgi:hypothetical protein